MPSHAEGRASASRELDSALSPTKTFGRLLKRWKSRRRLLPLILATIRPDFIALLVVVAVVNAPLLFNERLGPTHDSFLHFEIFHTFYGALLYGHRFPLWVPYLNYGMPSLWWQFWCLTPTDNLTILMGLMVRTRNVILLQKLSLLFEQFVFILGFYLFCCRLFTRRIVIFLLCVSAAAAPVWYAQLNHTFRMYYLFPFALYFIQDFVVSRRGRSIWIAGLFNLVLLNGNALYNLPLYWLTLLCFILPYVVADPALLRDAIRPSRETFLWFSAFVLVGLAELILIRGAMAGTSVVTLGRGQDGGVALKDFMNTPLGELSSDLVLVSYLYGRPFFNENNLYIGLLPLGAFCFGLVSLSDRRFLSVALPAITLIAMAMCGWARHVLFYFPLLRYYRPPTYVFSLADLFLLLGAGFGLEAFLKSPRKVQLVAIVLLLSAPLSFVACLGGGFVHVDSPNFFVGDRTAPWTVALLNWRLAIYSAGVVVYLLVSKRLESRDDTWSTAWFGTLFSAILCACLVVDLALFRAYVTTDSRQRLTSPPSAYLARQLAYLPRRTVVSPVFRAPPDRLSAVYSWEEQFEQADLFAPKGIPLVMSSDVADMIWNAPSHPAPREEKWTASALLGQIKASDTRLVRLLGVNDKLQFYTHVAFAADKPAALSMLRELPIDQTVVLTADPAPIKDSPIRLEPATTSYQIDDFSFNGLDVNYHSSQSGWLLYADAYDPDWTATVNGTPQPVLEADCGFKAVPIPAGDSVVHWRFGGTTRSIEAYGLFFAGALVGILFQVAVMLTCVGWLGCRANRSHQVR